MPKGGQAPKGGAYHGIAAECWIAVAAWLSMGFDSQCPDAALDRGRLPIERNTTMFKSVSNSLILRGVLALLFGLFSLISGVTMITRGVEIRRDGKALHSVLPKAA